MTFRMMRFWMELMQSKKETDMNKKNTNIKRYIISIILFAVLIVLDQFTKFWAASSLQDGPLALIDGVFEFYYLENHGAAFSMLQNAQVFFIIITVVFLVVGTYFIIKVPSDKHYLALRGSVLFIMAGALGNLIDRIVFGYVRDFLYFKLIDFPVFNVADIYVSLAVIFLAILILFYYKNDDFDFLRKKSDKNA